VHARRGSQTAGGAWSLYSLARVFVGKAAAIVELVPPCIKRAQRRRAARNFVDNNWLLGQVAVGSSPRRVRLALAGSETSMGQRTYGTPVPAGCFSLCSGARHVVSRPVRCVSLQLLRGGTQMTTWNVHVRGAGIAAGVQLDICLDGHEPVPPLGGE
jgi:hypothetical protein